MDGTRKTTVLLAIVLGVLIAATGVFVTLFMLERSAAEDVRRQTAVTERELAGVRDRHGTVQSTLDELADEERDLADTNDALHACADPTRTALRTVDDAALEAAIDQMLLHCGR